MIRIRHLHKEFPVKDGVLSVLPDIDLDVARGEFFVLLGPSGSGKSTLLRCIAGIDMPQGGSIHLDERLIYSSEMNVCVKPENRGLGMVFQSYAVWPHMTVYQNVALPLTHGSKRIPKSMVRDQVMDALSLVQMEKYADRPVPYLSGGQQQRVALARALAVEPVVLLMDEPLSNLDARLREEVRVQILSVTKMVGVTVLYVTHDQSEALALGDRIAVMDEGRIVQVGSADFIFSTPASPMIAEFLGKVNWIPGEVVSPGLVQTPIGRLNVETKSFAKNVKIGVRPSSIQLSNSMVARMNEFDGEIVEEIFLGEQTQLQIRTAEGTVLEVKVPKRTLDTKAGAKVRFQMDSSEILIYAA